MPDPYVGEIVMFGGNQPPTGWKFCNGQLLGIAENIPLFNVIGTTYGGDGTSNFNLPDLRGRVPIHFGTGPGLTHYSLGQKGGIEQVQLTEAEMPSHQHGVECDTTRATASDPTNRVPGTADTTTNIYDDPAQPTQLMNSGMITATGGDKAHTNIQPFLVISFMIALDGEVPT